MSDVRCDVCFHHCLLKEGKTGFCRARANVNGVNTLLNYGRLTSLAIDPIEKKPLYGFYPGSYILSAGSFGCNLSCPFCQNYSISMADKESSDYIEIMPDELLAIAKKHPESIGIAFTYNEPLISWEYVYECAKLFRENDSKTVLVTNGCISPHILEKLLPYIDAMNIDLKGDAEFYRELCGDYETVIRNIETASKHCHVEVTTLVIPGKNDSEEFIREEAKLLSSFSPDMILHLSRYFPRYRYTIPATDKKKLFRLKEIAEEYLPNVHVGNVW